MLIIWSIHFHGRFVYHDEHCSDIFSLPKIPKENIDNGYGFIYLHTGRYLVAPEKRTVLTKKGFPRDGAPTNENGDAYYPVHEGFILKKGGSIKYELTHKNAAPFFRQLMLEYIQFEESELPEENLKPLIKDIDAAAFDDNLLNEELVSKIAKAKHASYFLDFIIICASLISFNFFRNETWYDYDILSVFDFFLEPLLRDVFPKNDNLTKAVEFFASKSPLKSQIRNQCKPVANEMSQMRLVRIWTVEGLTWRGDKESMDE